MNDQQKDIAEKIISAMKEVGGLVYHVDSLITNDDTDRLAIIK